MMPSTMHTSNSQVKMDGKENYSTELLLAIVKHYQKGGASSMLSVAGKMNNGGDYGLWEYSLTAVRHGIPQ
jgi:hypothetical protein